MAPTNLLSIFHRWGRRSEETRFLAFHCPTPEEWTQITQIFQHHWTQYEQWVDHQTDTVILVELIEGLAGGYWWKFRQSYISGHLTEHGFSYTSAREFIRDWQLEQLSLKN